MSLGNYKPPLKNQMHNILNKYYTGDTEYNLCIRKFHMFQNIVKNMSCYHFRIVFKLTTEMRMDIFFKQYCNYNYIYIEFNKKSIK